MTVCASEIFEFLEKQSTFIIERNEITSATFAGLRRSLRRILLNLGESDDPAVIEICDGLRLLLAEWLTVPVVFEQSMAESIAELFGGTAQVQARWGDDVAILYEKALCAAENLSSSENPVREKIRDLIQDVRSSGCVLKIYCHRRARPWFETISVQPNVSQLGDNDFLHSVRDYRLAAPFDVLMKVGPLRSRGWSSVPSAILTAPRFEKLVQIVWSGCSDEPDFPYDPISAPGMSLSSRSRPVVATTGIRGIIWTTRLNRFGEDPDLYGGDEDDLQVLESMTEHREKRRATLIQVDAEHGIFYPPHSQVLSYDPNPMAQEPISPRLLVEGLKEGMFVIVPVLSEIDIGGIQAEHGDYSRTWKERLQRQWLNDDTVLLQSLRVAGLNLVHLRAAVNHWCKPPSSVIHAPQMMKHFEILLRVLDLHDGDKPNLQDKGLPWWRRAWNEIRRSRGEAIHAGFLEQELADEQLILVLKRHLGEVHDKALADESFYVPIVEGSGIRGCVIFLKVCSIEEGFSVPETELRTVRELHIMDQWRD